MGKDRPMRVAAFYLHPTRDVVLQLPRVALGSVNRTASWFTYPGGKALNAARTVGLLGGRCKAVVLAPAHWRSMLREFLGRFGVDLRMVRVSGEGRFCVILNEDGRETVVNTDLSLKIGAPALKDLARAVESVSRSSDFAVFSGSVPPNLGSLRYKMLLRLAKSRCPRLVIDASGKRLRQSVALRPWLIKPNASEFRTLAGRPLSSRSLVLGAIDRLHRLGVERVLLSLGSRGCLLSSPEGRWFAPAVTPPAGVVSPVGSGDALLGGFLTAASQFRPEREALAWGVAAATANTAHPGAVFMSAAEVRAILPRVEIRNA